jgi:hypothetical protein
MSIKTINKGVSSILSTIQKEISKRQEYYDSRTEEWQDTEKGLSYDSDSLGLEEAKDLIDEALDYL